MNVYDFLPLELWTQTIYFLPELKTLRCVRLVCKTFADIVDDQYVIHAARILSTGKAGIMQRVSETLTLFPKITYLSLVTHQRDKIVYPFHTLPNITVFDYVCQGPGHFDCFVVPHSTRKLHIESNRSLNTLYNVKKLPRLTHLVTSGYVIDNTIILALPDSLEFITIYSQQSISTRLYEDFKHLANLKGLSLLLDCPNQVLSFTLPQQLKYFSSYDCIISTENPMPNLIYLSLREWRIDYTDKTFPGLKILILSEIIDLADKQLENLPKNLEHLDVSHTPITEKAFSFLPNRLECLIAHHCDNIDSLSNLPSSIRNLHINHSNMIPTPPILGLEYGLKRQIPREHGLTQLTILIHDYNFISPEYMPYNLMRLNMDMGRSGVYTKQMSDYKAKAFDELKHLTHVEFDSNFFHPDFMYDRHSCDMGSVFAVRKDA